MDDQAAEIAKLKEQLSKLEARVAELMSVTPIINRRLRNLHQSFMAISGEVIEINEKLKDIIVKAFPGFLPTLKAINRIIRPAPEGDGFREPPHS